MGYRSDIRIKGDKAVMDEIRKTKIIQYADINRGNYVAFNNVKWYDSYEEIKEVNDILELAEENGQNYSFLRIGEDTRDIEEYTTNDDYIKYSIDIDFEEDKEDTKEVK